MLHVQVHVPPHPLVGHWLAVLRSEQTPTPTFRAVIGPQAGCRNCDSMIMIKS